MKLLFFILIFLISLNLISSSCEEGQIDINSASKAELDELYGVGPVKADAMINSRPFNSIDDLIEVYGIGEKTLIKIKEQGFACVNPLVMEETDENEDEEDAENIYVVQSAAVQNEEPEPPETIRLNSKNIKSQTNEVDKSKYAVYGFVGFCVLIGVLFIRKKLRYRKNEFR